MPTAFPVCLEGKSISVANVLDQTLYVDDIYDFATVQISGLFDATTGTAKVLIAISEQSDPTKVPRIDYIEKADELSPGGVYTRFGVLVKGGNYIHVGSNVAGVIYRVTALAQLAG